MGYGGYRMTDPEPSQGIIAVLGAVAALAGVWLKRCLFSGTVSTSNAQQLWEERAAFTNDLRAEMALLRADTEKCWQIKQRQEYELATLRHQVAKLEQQVAVLLAQRE